MTASIDGLLWTQQPDVTWYGLQPWWQRWVEAGARAEHGADLRLGLDLDRITYRVPIEVRGRRDPVDLRIEFHRWPRYDCYDLPPEEYPRVFAAPGAASPHRMPTDDALCLYFPDSPPWRRWRPVDGLLALIDLARDHVFFEDYWRATGGHRGGTWLGDEAPHGFPAVAA
ncbi:hypothetical protein JKP75_13310 [Blastococcus sp. TML/M2B]|uniref:hypothetical protein n=1 Tax=unclassified Blastococcus TaxID=2619396 RepID=UPI00190A7CBD|nr:MULTISPECIES: hypothetical protein [unclassified Blastococcus]MBN1093456.1 hypothetical protein [Blastococcus sp. TML/M2B]MBN1096427.1 hypothetical protein [Blastococcus sp. TML/C7B]